MTGAEFLTHLQNKGLTVELSDGRLKVSARPGVMTDALREGIRARRDELIAALEAKARPVVLAPIPRTGALPISRFQRRLWIMRQLRGPEDAAYGLATRWRIDETDDPEILAAALRDLIGRQEILRTIYPELNGEPVAEILPPNCITIDRIELGAQEEPSWKPRIDAKIAALLAQPFDLSREPSFRWLIVRSSKDLGVIVSSHHISIDHWSFGLLRQELGRSITAQAAGRTLAPPALQYVDFADWQRRREDGGALAKHLDWWATKLADLPDLCVFPPERAAGEKQEWRTWGFAWDAELTAGMHLLARDHRVTLYMILIAVCAVVLRRHTGQTDIVLGSSTGTREAAELETIIGPFVNVFALRLDLDDDPSFAVLLQRARDAVLDAHAHFDAPFEMVVERLNPHRSFDHTPLFQVAVILHNASDGPTEAIDGGGAMYDFTWFARETRGAMLMGIEYRSDLYSPEAITRITSHFEAVLRAAISNPTQSVSRIPLAKPSDVLRSISALQPPPTETLEVPFPQAFQEQARKTPTRTAVSQGDVAISYAALDANANRIARLLASRGMGPGDRVGVYMLRTPLMLAALIGVQRVGAAYVPLDPNFPTSRLAFMVEDGGVGTVLADTGLASEATKLGSPVLALDDAALAAHDDFDLPCRATPQDAAYVIYTSGSTGRPNGVVVPHRALSNFLASMVHEPGLDENDVVAAITTISFDIAALENFAPLLVGARIELIPRDTAIDGAALAERVSLCGATVLQATPASWRLLLDAGWPGTSQLKALCGGERLPRELADALLERVSELWNLYGPTETTVWSTAGRIHPGEDIQIGRPIANTQVYVVDAHGVIAPPGVAGEILIGGVGLAIGYHARDELNTARFIPNTFDSTGGSRLYRTGDLGMWVGGQLRHLGRLDHQVKIRGFRIEPGEIETALARHPAVRQAVVVPQGTGTSAQLGAYCALREGHGLTSSEARAHLRSILPDYMVPSFFEVLDAIPLTPNGKVDRKALPSPTSNTGPRSSFVACQPGLETELAEIWKEVLGVELVGANDNFFELGGHSLLSLRVVRAIEQRTTFQLEPRMLFTQTLKNIARSMKKTNARDQA